MAEVSFTILGKIEKMVCADGQEAHLLKLVHQYNERLNELKSQMGNITDQKLLLTCGLMLIDELIDAETKIDDIIAKINELS